MKNHSQTRPASNLPAEKLTNSEFCALAEFRLQIRRFLRFSEAAARANGLEPEQHQFLLAVRATGEAGGPTIGEIAASLIIRHHSAVGLADRLVDRGLVKRVRGVADRRQVRVRLTPAGERKLARLSSAHHAELLNSGPALVKSLRALLPRVRRKRI